jgi:hypothetical protein
VTGANSGSAWRRPAPRGTRRPRRSRCETRPRARRPRRAWPGGSTSGAAAVGRRRRAVHAARARPRHAERRLRRALQVRPAPRPAAAARRRLRLRREPATAARLWALTERALGQAAAGWTVVALVGIREGAFSDARSRVPRPVLFRAFSGRFGESGNTAAARGGVLTRGPLIESASTDLHERPVQARSVCCSSRARRADCLTSLLRSIAWRRSGCGGVVAG